MSSGDYYNEKDAKVERDYYAQKSQYAAAGCATQSTPTQSPQHHRELYDRRNALLAQIVAAQSKLDIVDSLINALIS